MNKTPLWILRSDKLINIRINVLQETNFLTDVVNNESGCSDWNHLFISWLWMSHGQYTNKSSSKWFQFYCETVNISIWLPNNDTLNLTFYAERTLFKLRVHLTQCWTLNITRALLKFWPNVKRWKLSRHCSNFEPMLNVEHYSGTVQILTQCWTLNITQTLFKFWPNAERWKLLRHRSNLESMLNIEHTQTMLKSTVNAEHWTYSDNVKI